MTDVLIRDVSDHALCVLAVAASSRGLSRSEFLRRVLENTARTAGATVTVADLEVLSEALSEGLSTRLAGGLAEGAAGGPAGGQSGGRTGG